MRKVQILCDRCGKQISGLPIHLIPVYAVDVHGKKDEQDMPPQIKKQQGRDYCEECIVKILDFCNFLPMEKSKNAEAAVSPKADKTTKKSEKAHVKKIRLDMGKVMALKRAGWSNEQIADEFGTTPGTIATSICRWKKKEAAE